MGWVGVDGEAPETVGGELWNDAVPGAIGGDGTVESLDKPEEA